MVIANSSWLKYEDQEWQGYLDYHFFTEAW